MAFTSVLMYLNNSLMDSKKARWRWDGHRRMDRGVGLGWYIPILQSRAERRICNFLEKLQKTPIIESKDQFSIKRNLHLALEFELKIPS